MKNRYTGSRMEKYITSYKARNGSTKNAHKSFVRYLEGLKKQNNQANRQKAFREREVVNV